VVLADSRPFARSGRYLGSSPETECVSCTGLLPTAAGLSRTVPLHISCTPWCIRCCTYESHDPASATPPGLTLTRFSLFPLRSPLLRESRLLSFPQGNQMFQFPWFPLPVLCVQTGVTLHDECRVSPFGYLRIYAWSTAPRSFSQSPTSFIGSWRQGIHRWLFVAWKLKNNMLVLALQFSRGTRRRGPVGPTSCRRAEGPPAPSFDARLEQEGSRRDDHAHRLSEFRL
jgi:hypothetical protein